MHYFYNNGINLILKDHKTVFIPEDDKNFQKIVILLGKDTEEADKEILEILEKENKIDKNLADYLVQLENEFDCIKVIQKEDYLNVLIDNKVIDDALGKTILNFYKKGLPIKPFINFFRKLQKNPSYKVVNRLYAFIEKSMQDGGFTINSDGNIIAYKRVNEDYKDFYTGKFDNSIGSVVEMPRNEVDDDNSNTCSAGLHFCSYSYLDKYYHGEGHVILVEVDPADVVSIPFDYNNAKARCSKYKVIGETSDPIKEPLYKEQEQERDKFYEMDKEDEAYQSDTEEYNNPCDDCSVLDEAHCKDCLHYNEQKQKQKQEENTEKEVVDFLVDVYKFKRSQAEILAKEVLTNLQKGF